MYSFSTHSNFNFQSSVFIIQMAWKFNKNTSMYKYIIYMYVYIICISIEKCRNGTLNIIRFRFFLNINQNKRRIFNYNI